MLKIDCLELLEGRKFDLEKQQLQQQLTLKFKKLCLKPTHCPRL